MNFFICMKPSLREALLCALLFSSVCPGARAQDDEAKKQEKLIYEAIDKEVTRLSGLLDLEDWQTFYVDSIMTHDYLAMQVELNDLRTKKVGNSDIYMDVQYKWLDKMYYAYEKVFDEDQWAKYLKTGAAREKKNREKHQSKSKK